MCKIHQSSAPRAGAEVPESPEDNFTTVLEREWNSILHPGLHLISLRKQLKWHPPPLKASDKRPRPSVPTLQRCLYRTEVRFQKKVVFLSCLLSVFRALSCRSYKCWEATPQATSPPRGPTCQEQQDQKVYLGWGLWLGTPT